MKRVETQRQTPQETTSAREACKGCGGSGLVGRSVTCPYCYGSGRSMYYVDNSSERETKVSKLKVEYDVEWGTEKDEGVA